MALAGRSVWGGDTADEDTTSHLLVVQVGEVDAVDFYNLVSCLREKQKRVSGCLRVCALCVHTHVCVSSLHSSTGRSPSMLDI